MVSRNTASYKILDFVKKSCQEQITIDFLLCRNSGGDIYDFKIKSKARPLLFPESDIYNLRLQ